MIDNLTESTGAVTRGLSLRGPHLRDLGIWVARAAAISLALFLVSLLWAPFKPTHQGAQSGWLTDFVLFGAFMKADLLIFAMDLVLVALGLFLELFPVRRGDLRFDRGSFITACAVLVVLGFFAVLPSPYMIRTYGLAPFGISYQIVGAEWLVPILCVALGVLLGKTFRRGVGR